ncbi:hypothetical protein BDF22DRAFT_695709 [Syncephalis plumigaleata]|nr:hypothetical protein BDF22DRAFT_695709 [Syncephalis plumigaleata]
MANLMSMALDDVIRQTSSPKKSNNNRRRNVRGQNKSNNNNNAAGAGAGAPHRRDRKNQRNSPYTRPKSSGNSNETWTHDLYEGNTPRKQRDARAEISGRKAGTTNTNTSVQPQFTVSFRGAALAANTDNNNNNNNNNTRITVTNLHYDVSRDDLNELFSQVGTVKRVYMHYDKADRSTGVADITFNDADSARRAIERYDKVPLDNQPMHITYFGVKDNRTGRPSILDRLGEKINNSDGEASPRGNRRSNGNANQQGRGRRTNQRRGRQPQRAQQPTASAEDLDRELDSYMQLDSMAQ